MPITPQEKAKENKYLKKTKKIIEENLDILRLEVGDLDKSIYRHNKYMSKNEEAMNSDDKNFLLFENELNSILLHQRNKYYQNLIKIKDNPYFASIIFKDEHEKILNIYIGITYLLDSDSNHIIYDWRAPICSMFYDFEIGKASYNAPEGEIVGTISQKRQFKIKNGKIVYIFDNNLNIDDEMLQEVLSTNSSTKLKNIVNTIQQEQNKVIRNTDNEILLVQGIAGSGKTSVALHRIAFLLYKIPNLKNTDILILSPNSIFTEYISDVLPELGEDNIYQTTFYEFLKNNIKQKCDIQTYDDFINNYYNEANHNDDFIKYKQSDLLIEDINNYIDFICSSCMFISDLYFNNQKISKALLNDMLKNKYSFLPLYRRINLIAIKLSEKINGTERGYGKIEKNLLKIFNIGSNLKKIYQDFYDSVYCQYKLNDDDKKKLKSKKLGYDDAIIYLYIQGLLKGFEINKIKHVVIDEAQDYTKLQFLILSKIFANSNFTILGDINQSINPYYQHRNLIDIQKSFNKKLCYLELLKTYRSSPEIIDYSNKILGLTNIQSIRNSDNLPVIIKSNISNLKNELLKDLEILKKKYKKVAIICKSFFECETISKLLLDDKKLVIVRNNEFKNFHDLVVLPVYLSKGLEFDAVIIYNSNENGLEKEKMLYYVACTRAQHELIIYNN